MLFCFFILLLLGIIYLALRFKVVLDIPDTFPRKGKTDINLLDNQKLVMCIGDSLTHGNLGENYVKLLENQLSQKDYCCINAGRNADLTYTLLNRLDEIIAYQPDFIVLLIGTNDVQATMDETHRKRYIEIKRIEKEIYPSFDTFKENYLHIIQRLEKETKAKIALVSLPIISEDLSHSVNLKADEYSNFIQKTALEKQFAYLPVREEMKKYLLQQSNIPKYSYENAHLLLHLSVIRHYIFRQNWNQICAAHGNVLTQDMLHFNTKGSSIISDLVLNFIKNK
jgi:lysophospholipase L1-like esterase